MRRAACLSRKGASSSSPRSTHAESTLRKTQGVRVLGRYPLTLSGQKSAIWVMETTPANEDA